MKLFMYLSTCQGCEKLCCHRCSVRTKPRLGCPPPLRARYNTFYNTATFCQPQDLNLRRSKRPQNSHTASPQVHAHLSPVLTSPPTLSSIPQTLPCMPALCALSRPTVLPRQPSVARGSGDRGFA